MEKSEGRKEGRVKEGKKGMKDEGKERKLKSLAYLYSPSLTSLTPG